MIKSKEKRVAARNRVAAGKRAGWPLSPSKKKGFEGFAGFVTATATPNESFLF